MPRSTARRTTAKRTKQAVAAQPEIVRVGIYLRRSTDDENQPYTIEAQEERLRSYVDSQPNWIVALRFADDASGATTERKDLQRALAAARNGLIDVLLVYRVDRLSRSLRDTVDLLEELEQAGVVFRSATEPFDTATPIGRMLLQILAMFAQFERDMIIDRVIAGMERKAAKGLWKGGRRPFGYQVDKIAKKLIIDVAEATIVRLIFDLYVRDRLGTRAIASVLNNRGLRTTVGGPWSGHKILRMLDNRAYLGELTFREITVEGTHEPIIDEETFDAAQKILTERSEETSRRASNPSDYYLTGRMRCPQCGTALIGTRATGRNHTYRYYTCHTRNRYNRHECDAPRLDADAVDYAVLTALAGFYRDHQQLIADAVLKAQRSHRDARSEHTAELSTIETELTLTDQAIDRYLGAFERGTLDDETLATRLEALRTKQKQLRQRQAELTEEIDHEPVMPARSSLRAVTRHIETIIETGDDLGRKALIEALVAEVKITGPDRLTPIFKVLGPDAPRDVTNVDTGDISQPKLTQPATSPAPHRGAAAVLPATTPPKGAVRAMPTLVEVRGLEPLASSVRGRRSTRLSYTPWKHLKLTGPRSPCDDHPVRMDRHLRPAVS
ncbi:Recombinase [Frankia casuarinae]|uniref:Recombinase n=1 Tax=Frankia casuarinae (strain DSM 45818 / CECT 9043 / HFP020203 / CcI3) TaxID=106370 RepID=Q2J5V3_FRACC|nr:Recombinase [Frankia casuarinae]